MEEEIKEESKHKGLRFNSGKLRYDLVHPWAHEQMVKILTAGSLKYAPRNWERGMAWSNVISSLKRHLAAIEKGEDFDLETGELHAAHLACNAHFLTAYYKIYPSGDDRSHVYLSKPKVGYDLDDVIICWIDEYCKKYNFPIPTSWHFNLQFKERIEELKKDKNFWINLSVKNGPETLPIAPTCYITSRSIPIEWTLEWLEKNGFPKVPVYQVPFNESKVEAAKKAGIDWFIDDKFDTFVEMNNAGICTFLYTAEHNKFENVGYRRIKDFADFKERFL